MPVKKAQKEPANALDFQMLVIKEFIDEFYAKTIYRDKKSASSNFPPQIIKFLFAFPDEKKAYPIGELGANARVKRSTMTDMVDRMEKDGIAGRERDNGDRRVVMVRLTDKGKQMRRAFYQGRRREFQAVFSQLTDSEVNMFISNLAEATKILKKIK